MSERPFRKIWEWPEQEEVENGNIWGWKRTYWMMGFLALVLGLAAWQYSKLSPEEKAAFPRKIEQETLPNDTIK